MIMKTQLQIIKQKKNKKINLKKKKVFFIKIYKKFNKLDELKQKEFKIKEKRKLRKFRGIKYAIKRQHRRLRIKIPTQRTILLKINKLNRLVSKISKNAIKRKILNNKIKNFKYIEIYTKFNNEILKYPYVLFFFIKNKEQYLDIKQDSRISSLKEMPFKYNLLTKKFISSYIQKTKKNKSFYLLGNGTVLVLTVKTLEQVFFTYTLLEQLAIINLGIKFYNRFITIEYLINTTIKIKDKVLAVMDSIIQSNIDFINIITTFIQYTLVIINQLNAKQISTNKHI